MEVAKEKKLLKFVKRNRNGKTGAFKKFFFICLRSHSRSRREQLKFAFSSPFFYQWTTVSTQTSRRHIRRRRRRPFRRLCLRSPACLFTRTFEYRCAKLVWRHLKTKNLMFDVFLVMYSLRTSFHRFDLRIKRAILRETEDGILSSL